ncbi:peptide deformylase [Neisseria gonorrhoeae]|uniref:Peptide deformylase n=1 Tax=Neisseria gonorrhoeae TaxID=485 RepID=A0A379B0I8_NEIGO|nr:peptide deformylase [Neisseria gonorrhoeae]
MALLNILQYPDERLHTVAKPVEQVDERIRKLVADMFETMYESRGIGLAATQVDVHERVVVMDLTEDRSEPRVFINPVIVEKTAKPLTKRAACPYRAFTTPLPAPNASRSRL